MPIQTGSSWRESLKVIVPVVLLTAAAFALAWHFVQPAPPKHVVIATGTALVLWFGVQLVLRGSLTSGALIVFVLYLERMYKPMKDLSKMSDTVSKAVVSLERIREVLDIESQVEDLPRARPAPAVARSPPPAKSTVSA